MKDGYIASQSAQQATELHSPAQQMVLKKGAANHCLELETLILFARKLLPCDGEDENQDVAPRLHMSHIN